MKILVAYASRMGSTAEIAERIGAQFAEAGHVVDVEPCSEAPAAAAYEAVILGSALYLGRWDKRALSYLKSQSSVLADRPTWLFQTGPCGEGFDLEHVDTPEPYAPCQTSSASIPRSLSEVDSIGPRPRRG